MTEIKNIILCADDFGLTSGISEGILKLAGMGRLSAVSCMVNSPEFTVYAGDLVALKNQIQIGLHFNLTEGYFLSAPNKKCFTLTDLLIKTHLGLIKTGFIVKEFNAQLDAYIKIIGDLPRFIDGHQHVHQFPIVRQAILGIYEQRLKQNRTYIRSTFPAVTLPKYRFKAAVLAKTGGKLLHSRLKKLDIPHNSNFSGVYDFARGTHYPSLFKKWLELVPTDTLIMCHPGEGISATDAIAHARYEELAYFLSDDFFYECQQQGIWPLNKTTCSSNW